MLHVAEGAWSIITGTASAPPWPGRSTSAWKSTRRHHGPAAGPEAGPGLNARRRRRVDSCQGFLRRSATGLRPLRGDLMRPLALHQMNALEVSAAELISIAHEVGCERVCVFVHVPRDDVPFDPVTPAMVGELRARMAATGVAVANVEFFPLGEDVEIESFRAPFELGAQLGAERIVTLVDDPVQARAAENLARVSDLAAEYDMQVGLEFMPMTPGCRSIHEAAAAPATRPTERRVRGRLPAPGPQWRQRRGPREAAGGPVRLRPDLRRTRPRAALGVLRRDVRTSGARRGVFPITEIFNALPARTPVEVEVPSSRAAQRGVPPLERVQRAGDRGLRRPRSCPPDALSSSVSRGAPVVAEFDDHRQ